MWKRVPVNGKRFGESLQLGSSISFLCEEGFVKTHGSQTISCILKDGNVVWDNAVPRCEAPCGGDLKAPSGIILSPGWPELYKEALNCEWVIEAPPGYPIKIIFDKFRTEVNYDVLEVRDGRFPSSPLIGSYQGTQSPHDHLLVTENGSFSQALWRLTGSTLPPPLSAGLFGNYTAQIRFLSDFSVSYEGFNITFSAIDMSSALSNATSLASLPGSLLPLFFLAECGSSVTGMQGVLLSPNYPGYYGNNHECIYSIQTQPGKGLQLRARDFRLEDDDVLKVSGRSHIFHNFICSLVCISEFAHLMLPPTHSLFSFLLSLLEVFDGSSNKARLLGVFTGNELLDVTLNSTSSSMWLEFVSDSENTSKGFELHFTSEEQTA
ncbi:hypothetical protein GOODEAATRI_004717 [Goodea atripinnis]|uniref:Uncharacterized protein n=1 Tax=Goodea atripinnis TaxID=208336 RepID=A0ABV0PKV2_9TELE